MNKETHKIKVLHVHTLPVVSGSGINTFLTMDGLDKNRYEVEFACRPGGALVDQVVAAGIRFHPASCLTRDIHLYSDFRALWILYRLMQREKYNITHFHNSKVGFIGRIAARLARVPVIIYTMHGFPFRDTDCFWQRVLFLWLERLVAMYTDALIAVSESLKEWGLHVKIGKEEQYTVIYSGIEIEKFQATVDKKEKKRKLGILPGNVIVGMVSKLWDGKGHACLLHAAKRILDTRNDVTFVFVGEGYLREPLEKLADELEIHDHILFTGFREDVAELNILFDIAVLASLSEGMGRVLLEAMAASTPVVATRVGGIVDIVDDRKTGILVAPDNTEELSNAIMELIKNEELRRTMGQAGRKKIDERFSAWNMVGKIDTLYQRLLIQKNVVCTARQQL